MGPDVVGPDAVGHDVTWAISVGQDVSGAQRSGAGRWESNLTNTNRANYFKYSYKVDQILPTKTGM